MNHVIEDFLLPDEIENVRLLSNVTAWMDGAATAGGAARSVKHNKQATSGPAVDAVARYVAARVRSGVGVGPLFVRHCHGLMLARYEPGMEYGWHVDNAMMAGSRRTDISATIFLSEADAYSGGLLHVDGAAPLTLRAGSLYTYPSTSLHRVTPVTSGERLVAVFWIESWIRDAQQRETLDDLASAGLEIFASQGKSSAYDKISRARENLIRAWAEG
ncbi:PiuC Uncharacterized iron-regulated protein [uncultured Caudovirales phage]|uniref:PiuC Uncharacterized iron-regulated protein n=1 Tax=uncultured Caudovirales phage TaxID=2100421 RepID=A0A6J5RY09_9CAUD|nr:PiuC Uncharacterized iron-regulated protein [uncultured Caudovirales phage]